MGGGVESQTGAQLLASLISLLALSSVSVILRLVARSTRGQTPGWDDFFVVMAWVSRVVAETCFSWVRLLTELDSCYRWASSCLRFSVSAS